MRIRHCALHTNGVVERWIETLPNEYLYRHDVASGADLADHIEAFPATYNAILR